MSLALAGTSMAKGAVATGEAGHIALCRFLAENIIGDTGSLRSQVTGGAASLAAAAPFLNT
jgi:hypothetical protein